MTIDDRPVHGVIPPTGTDIPVQRGPVLRAVAAHPVAALLLWFSTVGQAVAFIPVVSAGSGGALPTWPFVIASNLVGLALPAVAVTWAAGGPEAVRDLGRRLTPSRVRGRWYAFALVVVPLVTVALAVVLAGPPRAGSAAAVAGAVLVGLVLQTVLGLLTNNLAEEVAWTGVVQARLQRRRGPMVAALITGPLFALQHLSLAVSNAGSQALLLVALLVVLAVPFRALIGWAYNRTGSLLLVGLVHAAGNASAGGSGLGDGLLTLLYPGQALGPLHLLGAAVLGLVVVVVTRGRLGGTTRTIATSSSTRSTPPGTPPTTEGTRR
jgi:membrane protease YdiL (CAAX protease family)